MENNILDDILNEIKLDLGVNYKTDDSQVLSDILNKVCTNALFISNRSESKENIELLKYEIEECVKTLYLQRGTEDVETQNQSGLSQTFKKAIDEMRNNIVLNGKRKVK